MTEEEQRIREALCEVGRRVYEKGFVAGNDGNLSYRLSEDFVICTPTLICKGEMTPEDLCRVDLEGDQFAGDRKRTSEVSLHLEIYRGVPEANAVVHAHPPHTTAFAVARQDIPSGILPEIDIFLGVVPRTEYKTPGTEAFAAAIQPFLGRTNVAVLSNHGVVSWAPTLERAYWNVEMLEAYCRILILAKQVGNVERLSAEDMDALFDLRERYCDDADTGPGDDGSLYQNPDFGR